jgi:hypothetical protein
MNNIIGVDSITFASLLSGESVNAESATIDKQTLAQLVRFANGESLTRANQTIVFGSVSVPMDRAYVLLVESEHFSVDIYVTDALGNQYLIKIPNAVIRSQNPDPDRDNQITEFKNVELMLQMNYAVSAVPLN